MGLAMLTVDGNVMAVNVSGVRIKFGGCSGVMFQFQMCYMLLVFTKSDNLNNVKTIEHILLTC